MTAEKITRRRALAAGAAAVLPLAPSPQVERNWRIVIHIAPYATLAELERSPYPLGGGAADAARQGAHTALYAARELRQYLSKLNRIDPADPAAYPIAAGAAGDRTLVLIDASAPGSEKLLAAVPDSPSLDVEQSYAIVPGPARCFFIGRDRAGLLYSVYRFLDLQGIRWFAPGDRDEVVPGPARASLPSRAVIEKPRFLTRGFFTRSRQAPRAFLQWMARNRLNFWSADDPDIAFMKTAAIRLNAGAHMVFGNFLSPATYFQAHPEWYGLNKGVRKAWKGTHGVNPCSSNPRMIAELCRNIVAALSGGAWRAVDVVDFMALDASPWCECSACQALGTPTDRMVLMTHQLRQAIAAAMRAGRLDRNVRVFFPIYHETLPAPTRPLPPDFDYDNCIGTLFPITRCFAHGLDDPACTETNADIWKTIRGWQAGERHYRGGYVMGEYYNVSRFNSLPVLFTRVMSHDVPLYHRLGARHFHYMHVSTVLPGPKRFTNYLMARLLWDPAADVAGISRDYFAAFYAGAAEPMTQFYGELERAMSAVNHWKCQAGNGRLTRRLSADLDPLFPFQHLQLEASHPPQNDGVDLEESVAGLARCRAILDRTLAGAAGVLRERLLEDDRNLRYAEHTVNLYYQMARSLLARRRGDLPEARACYRAGVPHARALKQEVELVQHAFHANAKDALAASNVEEAWIKLGAALGLPPETH